MYPAATASANKRSIAAADVRSPCRATALLPVYADEILQVGPEGYGLLRAIVEVFRGDLSRGFVFTWTSPVLTRLLSLPPEHPLVLSISQVTALLMVAVGAWGLWKTRQAPEIAG